MINFLKTKYKQFITLIIGVFVIGGVYAAIPDNVSDIAKEKMQIAYEQSDIKAKYKMQNASFIMEAIDENAMQTEIGDKTADKFSPEMTLRKWSDEVSMNIKYKHNEKEKDLKFELDGKKIKLKGKKIETHFYEMENENYEFEIILLEKPTTNIVSFDIATKGLKFYYQPELTQQEKDDGAFRPENVIGSYAVYHESKAGDYSKMGLKNYRAGKAFHIYRPKIIDNAGKEVWGKLNITDNLLTVEIPQKFLDNAVYPVRHAAGLRFGYEGLGGSAWGCTNNIQGSSYAGAAGTVTLFTVGLKTYKNTGNYDCTAKAALYKVSDSSLAGQSVERTNLLGSTIAWWEFNASGTITSEAINYYMVLWGKDIGQYKWVYHAYDTGGTSVEDSQTYNGFPATASFVATDFPENVRFSIYCTYTAGGAGEEEAPKKQDVIWFD